MWKRRDVENAFWKREIENRNRDAWSSRVHYYKTVDNCNNKYQNWTSSSYYETQNEVLRARERDLEKQKSVEARREKLRKLFQEERDSFQVEITIANRRKALSPRNTSDSDVVPTELLKRVNLNLKLAEEEKRRHQAQLQLYNLWRRDNHVLKHHEQLRAFKDIKLSWLDQQVNKRMENEKAKEESARTKRELARLDVEAAQKEDQLREELLDKNRALKRELDLQVEQVKAKQQESRNLEAEEARERAHAAEIAQIAEQHDQLLAKQRDRETALFNIKQFKLKLKHQAQQIQQDLDDHQQLLQRLRKAEQDEQQQLASNKTLLNHAINELFNCIQQQKLIEKQRLEAAEFLFDSEAKTLYERQKTIWDNEQKARQDLVQSVLDTLKEQVDQKAAHYKSQQIEKLEERERALQKLQEYEAELQANKTLLEDKKKEWKEDIAKQVRLNEKRKEIQRLSEQEEYARRIEEATKEEERLKKEIALIQRKPLCFAPDRKTKRFPF